MKHYIKHLSITLIFILSFSYCNAQKKYTAGIVTANKKTYAVKEIESMVSLTNTSNSYTNEGMGKHYHGMFKGKVYPDMIGTTIDENKLKTILREEVGSSNIVSMAKDYRNKLTMIFTFSLEGKPLEVTFFTNNNTLITPAMFERIKARIKQEIHASFNETIRPGFTKPFYRDYDFIKYDVDYYYNKLVVN
jgi:hypothetical protein